MLGRAAPMISGIKPLTAIERARIAYELMICRQRETTKSRLSRDRSRTIRITVLGGCVLALLLSTAIYNDWLPASLRSSALTQRADDGKFVETRIGQVRSFIKGNT